MDKNIIKITDEEMAEIRSIQTNVQKKIFEFGNLTIERIALKKAILEQEEKEKVAEEELGQLQKMERDLLGRLSKRYGDGQLNMENGTFTPV